MPLRVNWERRRPTREPLTAAALLTTPGSEEISPAGAQADWQRDAWQAARGGGEIAFAVRWLAGMLSRVRLVAAKQTSVGDEPQPVTVVADEPIPPAVAMLNQLGATGGRSALLGRLAAHLTTVGESWLVGENTTWDQAGKPARWEWRARSTDEIRRPGKTTDRAGEQIAKIEVVDDQTVPGKRVVWRELPRSRDARRVVRNWLPDWQYSYLPASPVQAALPAAARLDLADRHIRATMLSRLWTAGLLKMPAETALPQVGPDGEPVPNPLIRQMIETASTGINSPGSAVSVVPMILEVKAEYLKDVELLEFASPLDAKILELADRETRKIATALDMPAEVLLGMEGVNHWTAWQIDESAVKVHISPLAELLCWSLTVGYLWPMLQLPVAFGGAGLSAEQAEQWVTWYDASELVFRPDRSEAARNVYDRGELSPGALRAHNGFDEDDKPTTQEVAGWAWRRLAGTVELGPQAIARLTGQPDPTASPPADGLASPAPPVEEPSADGPPPTRDEPPPPPGPGLALHRGNGRR